jgi:hypothetical protein
MKTKRLVTLINIDKNPVGPVIVTYSDSKGKNKYIEIFKGIPIPGLPESILKCEEVKTAVKKKRLKTITSKKITIVEKTEEKNSDQEKKDSGAPSGKKTGKEEKKVQDKNLTPKPSSKKKKQSKSTKRKNK